MSDESSEDETENRKQLPRFVKNSLEDIDLSAIYINTSNSQYSVLKSVATSLGWKMDYDSDSENWDVFWTDSAIESEQLFKMHHFQKINHFPGMYVLARKNNLGKGLMKMRKRFPEEYNFFPLTWHLPSEFSDLNLYFQTQPPTTTYISKPEASSQGKGIFLTRKLQDLQDCNCVVQVYMDRPYLISGLKFDLRVYVLLAGCDPLRIYIYHEGLARFATEDYKKPKKSNLKQAFIHLTNYAVNKLNPKFVFNKSSKDMDVGHKRSMTSVFKLMEQSGVDVATMKDKINDSIVKTIITGQPLLAYLYRLSQPVNFANDMCFQILGFDILIDEKAEPMLLEVNHTPSFTTDTPLDKTIKKNLIVDTLTLMNINIQNKNKKISQIQENNELRSQGNRKKQTHEQRQQVRKELLNQRDEYEKNNCKGFSLIYPSSDKARNNKYAQMLKFADSEYRQHIGIKKKNMSEIHNRFTASLVEAKPTTRPTPSKLKRRPSPDKRDIESIILPKLARSDLILENNKVRPIRQRVHQMYTAEADNVVIEVGKSEIVKEARDYMRQQRPQFPPQLCLGKFVVPRNFQLRKYQKQLFLEEDSKIKNSSSDKKTVKIKGINLSESYCP